MTDTKGVMNGIGSGKDLKRVSMSQTLSRSGVGNSKNRSVNGSTLQNRTEIGTAPENFQKGHITNNKLWEEVLF